MTVGLGAGAGARRDEGGGIPLSAPKSLSTTPCFFFTAALCLLKLLAHVALCRRCTRFGAPAASQRRASHCFNCRDWKGHASAAACCLASAVGEAIMIAQRQGMGACLASHKGLTVSCRGDHSPRWPWGTGLCTWARPFCCRPASQSGHTWGT